MLSERFESYALLSVLLIAAGLLDAWLVVGVMRLSCFTACALHGALLMLYAVENWILLRDFEGQREYIQSLGCLQNDKHNLENDKRGLEAQILKLRESRRVTFEDWYKRWHSDSSLTKKRRKLKRTYSLDTFQT